MATVYLAQDLKHDRKVALKVLRPELAAVLGADRFVVEIRTTAALQHPHILPLFDSGTAGGFLYYVMPFIDGETLRAKLDRETQLGIDEAVRIASNVADALDYAHRHGVIHRDIKPENILLHDGRPMVADFGIALAVSAAAGGRMTETGLSLGTPHYMSPEQATAEKEINGRSDIYSLASVLYEMLTGNPPHTGASAQQIIMKIVTEEAAPVTRLRRAVPAHVAAALSTALEKLPADRFESAKEFADALADRSYTTIASAAGMAPSTGARRWRRAAAAMTLCAVLLAAAAVAGWTRSAPPGTVRRFNIALDQYQADIGNPVVSRDGSRIIYANVEGALLMRTADDIQAKPVLGTESAWGTVFSPDSKALAINTGFPGAVRIIPLDGGAARTLVPDSTFGNGLAWGDDDWIYYIGGPEYGRDLMRIRATGGAKTLVARPDSAANALFFYWPQVLPGGGKIVLTVFPLTGDPGIAVVDVASGKVTSLTSGIAATYSPTGHLLVVKGDGTLQGARFDARRGTVSGPFTTLAEGLSVGAGGTVGISLSDEGTLMYQLAPAASSVVRVSREGREEPLDAEWKGEFLQLALSPDGAMLAIAVMRAGRVELWLKTLGSGALTRLSAGGTQSYRPSWSPDGRRVVFTSDQGGRIGAYEVPADGTVPPKRIVPFRSTVDEAQYSRDGKWIVFRSGSGGGRDIYAMQPGVDSSAHAIVAGKGEEFSPTLSPDGRWLAYASDETGRTEVYVRPFPDAASGRHTISHKGGSEPVWSHSGKELFFRDGVANLVAAEVTGGATFRLGTQRTLFSTRLYRTDNRNRHYSVAPDDRSFIFVKSPILSGAPSQVIVALNWFSELERRVGR
jgi:serine/threonine-protein kinase